MGVDRRVKRQDYNVRYKVYKPTGKSREFLEKDELAIGILHAKDITSYNTSVQTFENSFARPTTAATIETTDIIDINVNYFLKCLANDIVYRVTAVRRETMNENQRFSARPITRTQIDIITKV